MKRIIIVGATSGIGREVALLFAQKGWTVGIAGRRKDRLEEVQRLFPDQIQMEEIDITRPDAPSLLNRLIEKCGGMDIYFHASGIGKQNRLLERKVEMDTLQTNGIGFTQMINAAWHYFAAAGQGHIAAITSIAGTKGLGSAPAYSATKAFQNCYLDSLSQLAHMNRLNIGFTDIRPGFVKTDLLDDGKNYPMLLKKERVARIIVNAVLKRRRRIIVDWRYAFVVFFWRLIPNYIWERLPIRN